MIAARRTTGGACTAARFVRDDAGAFLVAALRAGGLARLEVFFAARLEVFFAARLEVFFAARLEVFFAARRKVLFPVPRAAFLFAGVFVGAVFFFFFVDARFVRGAAFLEPARPRADFAEARFLAGGEDLREGFFRGVFLVPPFFARVAFFRAVVRRDAAPLRAAEPLEDTFFFVLEGLLALDVARRRAIAPLNLAGCSVHGLARITVLSSHLCVKLTNP